MHFSKKSGQLSSAGAEIQHFVSHCSANFSPILDCFISNFKLKYEDSENIKADRVNTVVFNLQQIKRRALFFGTPGIKLGSIFETYNTFFNILRNFAIMETRAMHRANRVGPCLSPRLN